MSQSQSRTGNRATHLHELLVVERDPSVAIRVRSKAGRHSQKSTPGCHCCDSPLERFGERLDYHACPHEAVECDTRWRPKSAYRAGCVLLLDERKQRRREIVPEAAERLCEFRALDRPGLVAVKVPEDALPICDIFPQAGEFYPKG